VAHDDKHHYEIILARRLWHLAAKPNEILFSNRGFCSYLDIAQLLARVVDCVMRLDQGPWEAGLSPRSPARSQ
jgi:hypothetical protein